MPHLQKLRGTENVNGKNIYSDKSAARKITLKSPAVKGDYSYGSVYGPYLDTAHLAQVRSVVQSFKLNYIRKGMSDYDKVLTAFNYLRSNCRYAYRGWQYNYANTAWGALVYGEAQCSGYARAMKALCDASGVDCRYIHANAKASNPSHQWNQVKVGGKWYILDAQSNGFLLGTNTWIKQAGMSWDTKGLPTCSKTDYKSSRRELITPSYSIVSEDRKARRTTGWSLLLPVAAVMFYMQNTAYTGTIR